MKRKKQASQLMAERHPSLKIKIRRQQWLGAILLTKRFRVYLDWTPWVAVISMLRLTTSLLLR